MLDPRICLFAALAFSPSPGALAQALIEPLPPPSQPSSGTFYGARVALEGSVGAVGSETLSSDPRVVIWEQGPLGGYAATQLPVPFAEGEFGQGLDVDGGRVAVGSHESPVAWPLGGAVYLYEKSGAAWTLSQTVTSAVPTSHESFGSALSLDGDTLAVGAWRGDGGGVQDAGEVHMFERQAGVWVETAVLAASDPEALALFGMTLALDGDVLAVGAKWKDEGGLVQTGAVYVFERSASGWSETAKLLPSTSYVFGGFGVGLDLDGDRIAVGALNDQGSCGGSLCYAGATFVFERGPGGWSEVAKLLPPTGYLNSGVSVALDAERLLAGSIIGALLFERVAGTWQLRAEIGHPASAFSGDDFGKAVALSGERAFIGAAAWDGPCGNPQGCFDHNAGTAFAYDVDLLRGSPAALSLAAGGSQLLELDAGLPGAGLLHLLLGTLSGTQPGMPLGALTLHLNTDAYTLFTLNNPGAPPLLGGLGVLDAAGEAVASFALPAGAVPGLAGASAHHAYVLIDPSLSTLVAQSSNAVRLDFLP